MENDISYLKVGSIDDTNDDKDTICRPTYDKDIQNVNSDLEIGSIEARNNDKYATLQPTFYNDLEYDDSARKLDLRILQRTMKIQPCNPLVITT